ncbi:MAG: site-specific integrase [bacterium]|nr:site-specific integrase [bacterium]
MSHEEMARASDVPSVKVHSLPAGRHVNRGELAALFAACADGTAAGTRDAAILSLAYGMRRSEVASIEYSDVDLESGRVRVVGKGNKQRDCFIANGGLQALRDWASIRGTHAGPLLHPIRRGGRVIDRTSGMSSQSVYGRIERRRKQAGVQELTPHDLRRSFIGDALDAGVDLIALQRLVGHSSPQTTSRYDRRGERAAQAGASLLHLPYVSR